ncbi:MAG: leucine-rich repeat domain-containing protein, partial [Oscillospiraceae bacterium]|nr:leucine-rich repeat domain-containing protein [Oscillospiraceae bacterium]
MIIEDGVFISYNLRENCVEVPKGVKTIGKGAFKGCTSIEEMILPETVTEIMDESFKGCRKLKKINFPKNLEVIGPYAFHRCHNLKSIDLPETTKEIGNCAFLYCDSLEYAHLPGVIHIGKQAFLNDLNLKEIKVSNELDLSCINEVFLGCYKINKIILSHGEIFSIDNIIDLLNSQSNPIIKAIAKDIFRIMEIKDNTLVKFLVNMTNVEIPTGIIKLEKSSFFDKKGIVSVKFPDTLKEIEKCAFGNCINLERLEFLNGDIEIKEGAFKNCTSLKTIVYDKTEYEIKGLTDNAPPIVEFIHKEVLSNFFISGTTLIKYRGSEERVVVPYGITAISERAFSGNEIIDRVVLPDTVKEIHEEAFADCVLMQTINLPESLEVIYESAFENCVKLIRIEIPEFITKIRKSTFSRCKKLKEVKLSSSLIEIGNLAFYGCESLKSISFPDKLEKILDLVFYKCASLIEVKLPKSLKKLGSNAFTLSGVRDVIVQSEIDEMGTDVFSECNRLTSLAFYEGVNNIGDKFAFKCANLKYVRLPETILYIGKNAFEGSIYIKNNAIDKNIFLDRNGLSGSIAIPEGIVAIAGGAFYSNNSITSITLPKTLKTIGSRAFCNSSLKSIHIPEGVEFIEEGAFAYCDSLEEIFWDGEIYKICDNAFYGCDELTRIPLLKTKYIGKNAFNGCTKLNNIEVEALYIDEGSFRNTGLFKSDLNIISNIVVDGAECYEDIIIPEGIKGISPFAFSRNE